MKDAQLTETLPTQSTLEASACSTPSASEAAHLSPLSTDKVVWKRTDVKLWLASKIQQELCDLNIAIDILDRYNPGTCGVLVDKKTQLQQQYAEIMNGT